MSMSPLCCNFMVMICNILQLVYICLVVSLIRYIASTTEAWELSSLAHKVNNIHSHLSKQLSLCHQHIGIFLCMSFHKSNFMYYSCVCVWLRFCQSAMMKHDEAYRTLVRLFETPHIDNMKVLKALIYPKDDQLPLFESSTKRRVNFHVP